jgi:hypothetical protein
MKEFVKIDQAVGGDGAKVKAALGVEKDQLKLELSATYPIEKVIDPAMKVVDNLLDKVEQWIPGDQKDMANQFKKEARQELVKLLSEQP